MKFTVVLDDAAELEVETRTRVPDAAYLDVLAITFVDTGDRVPGSVFTRRGRQRILDRYPQAVGDALDRACSQQLEQEELERKEPEE